MAAINRFLACVLAFGLMLICAQSQAQDSAYTKQELRSSDISLLMSYYDQDGIHSAVTGGQGTEKLEVYAINLNSRTNYSSGATLILNLGVDIISSASTDNIDFEVSSVSSLDQRTHMVVGYEKNLKNDQYIGMDVSYSIESDYTSRGVGIWYQNLMAQNTRRFSARVKFYFDDLRWGRLSEPYLLPEKLIYPEELRYKEWFDIHNRYSLNINFGYEQDLNKKMNLGLYPSLVFQRGLLSTPFHRVYFEMGSDLRVENLPRERAQFAFGVQYNYFLGKRTILRIFYQAYYDQFGIGSNTVKLELPYKINANLSIAPFGRFYHQSGARYFKTYAAHRVDQEFYTSDFDLSSFWSGQLGLNMRLALTGNSLRNFSVDGLNIRYSYYDRSDGLTAHIISLLFQFRKTKFKDLIKLSSDKLDE